MYPLTPSRPSAALGSGSSHPAAAAAQRSWDGPVAELLTSDETRLLASIGMLGLSRGALDAADTIFAALRLARPGAEIGPLGQALVKLAKGDARGAAAILNAAPPSDAIYFFQAVALRGMGEEAEARDILENLAAVAADPIRDMARQMIEQVDA